MRMRAMPRQMLGLLRAALCPGEARLLRRDIDSRRCCTRLGMNPTCVDRLPRHEIRPALSRACAAIRLADSETAIAAMAACGAGLENEAACLNVLGALAEMLRLWRAARWLYGQALFVDKSYGPAECNLRRLYELYTFGRTRHSIALGDEMKDVWFARFPEPAAANCR